MSNTMVEAKNWSWRYAGRREPAIAHLDLSIAEGERVLIAGASGSGKSTIIHGIAGLLADGEDGDEHGELSVLGQSAHPARGAVGLVIQDPASQVLMEHVGDDVAFGCENLAVPRREIWQRTHVALERVGLDISLQTPTHALSGGQQQRMALAGVLAMQPRIIALDEPTANLDPQGAVQVRDAVASLPHSQTIIIVEHRLPLWLPVVDRLIVVGDTGIIADGDPHTVIANNAALLEQAGIWLPELPVPELATRNKPRTNPPILSTDALTVGYGDTPVHLPITHAFAQGTCTAVIGNNGAGKSTFARTIAGLQRPIAGTVTVDRALAAPHSGWRKRGATTNPVNWRSRDLPSRIGFVFQNPGHQFVTTSVGAELRLAETFRTSAHSASNDSPPPLSDALLESLGLKPLLRANPHTLSGGEQRRLSVATALAAAPPILILDEPTFGQDANTWRTLVHAFARLRDAGHTLVLITHDLPLIDALQPNLLSLGTR